MVTVTSPPLKKLDNNLEARIENQCLAQRDLIALQTLVPDLVSNLDLSLKVVSAFNGRQYVPTPIPNLKPKPNISTENNQAFTPEKLSRHPSTETRTTITTSTNTNPKNQLQKPPSLQDFPTIRECNSEKFSVVDGSGSPLTVVRAMVAVCLLERVPFSAIDSSRVLRKLENDPSATSAEKSALLELGGESGAILAVEMALRSMASENGGVELEEFVMSGKSRVMVLAIDRDALVKELPENSQHQQQQELNSLDGNQFQPGMSGGDVNGAVFKMGATIPRPLDMWLGQGDPNMSLCHLFHQFFRVLEVQGR